MMKKTPMNILLSILLTAFALAGCKPQAVADGGKPLVYASFYPMYDLALKAAGDYASVRCLVPDGSEPHDWEPSPADIIGISEADLFFYSGAGFETWVDSILRDRQEKNPRAVETSEGIALAEGDPHVWLAPQNAKRQFLAMVAALKEIDPENSAGYDKNAEQWLPEFDKLDSEYKELQKLDKKAIAVTHEAFGYLCGAYGLGQISPLGYSPGAEPDPAGMAAAVEAVRKLDIKIVFYDETENIKYAKAIASETGAEVMRLSPLEGLTGEEAAAGADYFSVMRENLSALKEALK